MSAESKRSAFVEFGPLEVPQFCFLGEVGEDFTGGVLQQFPLPFGEPIDSWANFGGMVREEYASAWELYANKRDKKRAKRKRYAENRRRQCHT
ncbi:MAG: hypothetical protein Hyperionvirus4_48 [Hyperionvirus sp.]|uniref:Uncharacterized protein n=1 Tax=Hyperionvirus sp. TaxID=2487770 RepID=A0A3G5AB66_9VIRU|nr:MAG: hypothetical protein Hyperionvirus4_48 [Hyperionvirus sp.]